MIHRRTTFTKNRDRLVQHEGARQFFEEVVRRAKKAGLVSAEHFIIYGTLIEAWASMKSLRNAVWVYLRSQEPRKIPQ